MTGRAIHTRVAERAVWKFELEFGKPLLMPANPKIISVDLQDAKPFLWALVDPSAPLVERRVLVLTTGLCVEAGNVLNREFLGTIIGVEGHLVLHVFDEELPF